MKPVPQPNHSHSSNQQHLNLNTNNNTTSIHNQTSVDLIDEADQNQPTGHQQPRKSPMPLDDHESADLCDSCHIDIHTILDKLHAKFKSHHYYTEACANTLIAINPFKDLAEVYSPKVMDLYHNTSIGNMATRPAHIYKHAATAWHMIKDQSKQTILVSGDSGSGKTRSINFIIRYYSYITSATPQSLQIKHILLKTNQILESFGNAKTALNDNSSRFGKYIKLHFCPLNNELVSAQLITYLLEKTRSVNYQSFNFHIFHELLFGANQAQRAMFLIDTALLDKYSNDHVTTHHALYAHKLDQLKLSFQLIDVKATQILSVISAIAHLNCCVFSSTAITASTSHHLTKAASLLHFDLTELANYLLVHELRITNCHSDLIQIPCNVNQIEMRKNALVKLVYNELFKYLVKAINKRLQFDRNGTASCCIGLLDIYGFECMPGANSLEQLCINYANEKLHNTFVHSYFKLNQLEYESEFGSELFPVEYSDNLPLLRLIESSANSLFSLLNEQSILKSHDHRLNDDHLLVKLRQKFGHTDLIYEPKLNCSAQFFIRHFAGHVGYKTECLTSKNADHIPDDLVKFLAKSNFLSDILSDYVHKKMNNAHKKSTVLSKFKHNLDNLINKLKRTSILYVRCIKPNCALTPDYFDVGVVRSQLESCGIASLLDLSKRGFVHKFVYAGFALKYRPVVRGAAVREMLGKREYRAVSERVAEASGLGGQSYRLGRSKIFVKEEVVRALDALLAAVRTAAARLVQRGWRAHRNRVRAAAAAAIQAWWSGLVAARA
ncbi:unconventional myosin-XIX isoform X1, partial [Brachionus plicatilis]